MLGIALCGVLLSTQGFAADKNKAGTSYDEMTGTEKIEEAAKARRVLAESAARIQSMYDGAVEAAEEASRVRCLNNAVSSVQGFQNVSQKSYERLQVAVSSGDERAASHHLMMVTTSAKRSSSIEAKAVQCIGSALRYTGDEQTVQEVDPRLGEYDPVAYGDDSGGPFIFLEELPSAKTDVLPPRGTGER